MKIRCEFLGTAASFEGGKWESRDEGLAEILQSYTDRELVGYFPEPDYDRALAVAANFGGKVLTKRPTSSPGGRGEITY